MSWGPESGDVDKAGPMQTLPKAVAPPSPSQGSEHKNLYFIGVVAQMVKNLPAMQETWV